MDEFLNIKMRVNAIRASTAAAGTSSQRSEPDPIAVHAPAPGGIAEMYTEDEDSGAGGTTVSAEELSAPFDVMGMSSEAAENVRDTQHSACLNEDDLGRLEEDVFTLRQLLRQTTPKVMLHINVSALM